MSARNEDFLFAQEAQSLGYVTEAQAEEGFLLQRRMVEELQIDERLAVILVKRGWLADEQARRVYGIIEPEGARSEIEGYRLIQKVGRGAMGTVYKALHKGLNRVVAIKILRRDLAADKTQIERLKREAKLLADLEHPNIVRAFDAGEANGFPYLVMEFVEGDTLRDKISREGTLDDDEALRITRALADALEKARRMGIVHRDVKPGNILISKSGVPKLMDLGLAKGPIDAGLTQHGATVGTPQFMSPEQAESPDKADTRSDIYSLGATLYAMVTGRPPFEGTTLAEIITKVMSHQPVPPRVRNANVSPEVSHLIERMMLKDASLRHATPLAVIEDIDRIRGGQSIIPRGFQGNWEAYLLRKRFLEWRKRIVVGLAAAVLLSFGTYFYLKHVEKTAARLDAQHIITQLESLPNVRPDDKIDDLGQRRNKIDGGLERLREISESAQIGIDRTALKAKRDIVHDAFLRLRAANQLAKDLGQLRRKNDLKGAMALARASETEMRKSEPSRLRWEGIVRELRKRSSLGRSAAIARVDAVSVTDLASFEAKQQALVAVYEAPWIEESNTARARANAGVKLAKARDVRQAVATFDEAFSRASIKARVAALELYPLRIEFGNAQQQLRADVAAIVRAWPDSKGARARLQSLLLEEGGIVSLFLQEKEASIGQEVEGYYEQLTVEIARLPVPDALRRLTKFINAAERGSYYREVAARARALHDELRNANARLAKEQQERYKGARQRVLDEFRRGDPDRIREAVAQALKGSLTASQHEQVTAWGAAADALDALHAGALQHVKALLADSRGRKNVDVKLWDGNGRLRSQTWTLLGVDVAAGELRVRVPKDIEASGERRVAIKEVSPATLLVWFRQTGTTMTAFHKALLELAVLPPARDTPGVDLRPLIQRYRLAQTGFNGSAEARAWQQLAGGLVEDLQAAQYDRSDLAVAIGKRIERDDLEGNFKALIERVDRMLDPKGRLFHTQPAEDSRNQHRKFRARAVAALEKDELRRLFHGDVQPTPLPLGMTRLGFDLDDAAQLGNFERGFAVWEPAGPAAEVTPGSTSDRGGQLRLLPGVTGLVRDRPLSFVSPFDPNRAIVLEFKMHSLRGSSMLAFDIDGVQIAICSFDPSFWKRRFPPGTPLRGDEESLPEFDFYGMGRGVAFHEGPDFGPAFPLGNWDWAVEGRGRNFAKLRERGTIEKARGRLFAFAPGGGVRRIKIVRDRDVMSLYVGDMEKEVIKQRVKSWATRGKRSPTNKSIRNGSGRIQILSWSPIVIDDLQLTGVITERWMEQRRLANERAAAAAKKAAASDKEGAK